MDDAQMADPADDFWQALAPEQTDQVRELVAMLMRTIGPAADHYGWPVVFSALPTILTPLLTTAYGVETTQAIFRRIADETPRIAEGWQEYFADLARGLAARPVAGSA